MKSNVTERNEQELESRTRVDERLAYSRLDASRALSISTRTLDRLVSEGKIKKIKLYNRRTVFLKTELERYLESEMEAQHG